jgi:hypothetical protein
MTWYLGTMNDGLFIIDGPPRPGPNDTGPWDIPNDPQAIAGELGPIGEAKAKQIVEAHNAVVASLRTLLAEAEKRMEPFARFADSIEQLDRVEVDHIIRRLTPADFYRTRALHAKIEKALGGGTEK